MIPEGNPNTLESVSGATPSTNGRCRRVVWGNQRWGCPSCPEPISMTEEQVFYTYLLEGPSVILRRMRQISSVL